MTTQPSTQPDFDKQLAALAGQEVQVYPGDGKEPVVGILEDMGENIYTVGDSVLIFLGDVESIHGGLIYMQDSFDGNLSYDD